MKEVLDNNSPIGLEISGIVSDEALAFYHAFFDCLALLEREENYSA